MNQNKQQFYNIQSWACDTLLVLRQFDTVTSYQGIKASMIC